MFILNIMKRMDLLPKSRTANNLAQQGQTHITEQHQDASVSLNSIQE